MASDAEGTPFGRYRLIGLLGRGGMGEVWRAYDPVNARPVALKVLPANYADDQVFQERFRREARAAAGLDEPHVVPIYDSGEIDGRLFVSMRLVKGRNLEELVGEGPLAPARAVGIIEQIASALHAAHKVDLVHRDVKPSNILITDDDFAYLIDFGIARAAGETGLTSTGTTIGTWAYMAPERFKKAGVAGARADTYALACVLYEALTGQPPFPADAIEQIAVAHLLEPPPRPSEYQAGVPAAMDDVIATGMAKDPDQRYATTKDLARAARAALNTVPHPPAPVPEPGAPQTETAPEPTPPQEAQVPITPALPTARADPPPVTMAATSLAPQPQPAVAAARRAPTQRRGLIEAGPEPSPLRPTRRRRTALILTAAGVTVAVVIAIVTLVVSNQHHLSPSAPGPETQPPASGSQTVLPFTGLNDPGGVAVDGTGTVYVSDCPNNRVLKLQAGSTAQTELPFTGLKCPNGVAVDGTGTVYVTDYGNNRVVKLAAGATAQTALPFTGLSYLTGVAVDGTGAVYVTSGGNNRVVKLAAGSTAQTALPFTDLNSPEGVAVDGTGAVYVTDLDYRVVKLERH